MNASLESLQRQFLGHLRGKRNGAIFSDISHGRMPANVGLRIYTHAYGARLREALEHDHPVLGLYLGDVLWEKMCYGYLLTHPSHHRSLRDFGAELPAYLGQARAFRWHPEVAELALFERLLLDSFDAADAERADWNRLLELPESAWTSLRLRLHPSLKLPLTVHNSVEIWRAIKNGQTPPPVSAADTNWALWRDTDRVSRFRSLDAAEHAAISHCVLGGNFVGMCDLLLNWNPAEEVPRIALGYLNTWCAEGWISHWLA